MPTGEHPDLSVQALTTGRIHRGLGDEDWHARYGPGRIDRNGQGQAPPASVVDELKRYHEGDLGETTAVVTAEKLQQLRDSGLAGTPISAEELYAKDIYYSVRPAEMKLPVGKVVFEEYRPSPPPTSNQIVQALSQHMKDGPERQLERRRAWARFAAAAFELSELSELSECRPLEMTVGRASRAADLLLAEYDRRFGA